MKAKQLRLVVSRTFVGEPAGLPRFESFKVEVDLTFEFEEGDTAEAVRQHMIEEIRKSLSEQYRAYHPKYLRSRNENPQLSR